MATVHGHFREYIRRLELNPARAQAATARFEGIKRTIESAIEGSSVSRIGSFQRQTKIKPVDLSDALDVDVLVCLGEISRYAAAGERGLTSYDAIQRVRRALRTNEIYRVMDPEADAPTVVLEYSDPTPFAIELVPAYRDMSGRYPRSNGPACYIVPSSDGARWVPADYDYDADVITVLNQSVAVGGDLVPAIKLFKGFLRARDIPLKSFHVEILAARIVPTTIAEWRQKAPGWKYQHLFAAFLRHASDSLGNGASLPGSFSPPVDSGLSSLDRLDVSQKLGRFATLAWKLCDVAKAHPDAEDELLGTWGELMGVPFPPPSWSPE